MKICVPTKCMHFNYKNAPNADTAPRQNAYHFLYSLYNNFSLTTRTYYTYNHSKNDSQLLHIQPFQKRQPATCMY